MTKHTNLALDVAVGIGRGKSIKHWKNTTTGWWKIVEQAATPAPTKEGAGSWLFGKLRPTPDANHESCTQPCEQVHRNKDAVVSRNAITLDVDDAPADFPDRVQEMGIEALLHTTFSSTPDGLRLRLIAPADRDMKPQEYTRVADEVMRRLSRDGDPEGMWDRTANQASRLMYRPASPTTQDYRLWHLTGELLGVDLALLDAAIEEPEVEESGAVVYDDSSPITEREADKAHRTLAKAVASASDLVRPDGTPAPGRNEWVKDWATPLFGLTKAGALDRDAVEEALWEGSLTAPGDADWDRAECEAVLASVWSYVQPQRPRVETEADDFTPVPPEERIVKVEVLAHPQDFSLRIAMAENPGSPMPNARLLLRRCPPLLRWRGGWYAYVGGVYQSVSDDWIRKVIYHAFEDAQYTSGDKTNRWNPSPSSVNATADALGAVAMVEDRTEPDASRINLRNGLLDMGTRLLAPHSQDVFSVVQLPFAYDPDATCPQWLTFLKEVFEGDEDTVALVQEMFGYVVSGRTDMQKLFYLMGPRRGGKGVTLRTLAALVGHENVASPTVTSYAKDFGLASLVGKTLATTADARFGRTTDIQTVTERWLTITGEDRISVPRKFKEDWVGTLGTRIVVASNETPPFRDASAAVVSRLVLVRFRQTFLNREDVGLSDRLLAELPGILNWALDGADRLARSGRFTEPAVSRELLAELEEEASPVKRFVREKCLENGGDTKVRCSDFIATLNMWLMEHGEPHMSNRAVGMALRSAFPRVDMRWRNDPSGRSQRHYVGIGWAS